MDCPGFLYLYIPLPKRNLLLEGGVGKKNSCQYAVLYRARGTGQGRTSGAVNHQSARLAPVRSPPPEFPRPARTDPGASVG